MRRSISRKLCFFAILLWLHPLFVQGQENSGRKAPEVEPTLSPVSPSQPPSSKAAPPSTRPGRLSERAFLGRVYRDQREIWTAPLKAENYKWRFVVPFGLATAALISTDKHVGRELSEGPPGTGFDISRGLAYIGSAGGVYGFGGAFYGLARWQGNDGARETGLLALEALVDSTIVVQLLKLSTQRERPTRNKGRERINNATGKFGAGGSSFPSGHAINSFALASVFAARYPDRPLVQWTAYSLASTAAIARMTSRKHFPSDILVGGVLGYLIGRHVVRSHTPAKPGAATPLVLPRVDRSRKEFGISVQIRF